MTGNLTDVPDVGVEALELDAADLDPKRAAAIYEQHGALVVRGLMKDYAERIREDIESVAQQAMLLVDQATPVAEGWTTPDGALWLPAPAGFARDKQLMLLPCSYNASAAFLQSALHAPLLNVVESILGPDIELFGRGQCLYKEPCGGHPKLLHQDGSYFEHKYEGPCAVLNYCVDTDVERGALHVIPGSHRLGLLRHVDTFSHLGLDPDIWAMDRALPIEGRAGDAIFFHINTIHGSPENNSDKARPVFIHRYRRADDYVVIGGSGTANRAEAEKHIAQAKKENERGLMVRGRRGYENVRP